MNFSELTTAINNAFFKLESFMNGTMTTYEYFGFNEAFTKLFNEARKPDNFTYGNCKLIGKYWALTLQIMVDFDKGDFENLDAYENEMFCKDCNEIEHLNWERIEEFTAFSTPDEIAEFERKFSITDILKAPAPPPPPTETKTDTFKAKLGEHGFFELPKVKILTGEKKQKLVELIGQSIPYAIAMLENLDFLEHLKREYFKTNEKLFKSLAEWFETTERTVKGNYNVLNEDSQEDRFRYTAHKHKESAVKEYEALR